MAKDEIDRLLRAAVSDGRVPGVVALAADRNGTFYQGAFGRRGLGLDASMTLDTVFRIASMTKAVTGVAAMQCVERGKLALDQPAGEIMPELAEPQVLEGFDADGKPILRAARRKITLRMLLTHTAGFVYHVWNAQLNRYVETTDFPTILSGKLAVAERTARLRAWRALGIRHQHRLGRPHGGDGQRPGPRGVYAREHLRPTRHARHRVRAQRRSSLRGMPRCMRAIPTDRLNRSRRRRRRPPSSTPAEERCFPRAPTT